MRIVLQHERPDVEPARELVVGDRELRADLVREHHVEQARDGLARGRVAEGEVLERRDVVLAGVELAHRRLAVPAGPADLLGVRLEALGEVEVVDVADVGLVDAHAEGDRRDDDVAGRRRPPLLRRDAILGSQPGVVGAGGKARRREERGDPERGALQRDVDDRRPGRAFAKRSIRSCSRSPAASRRRQERQVGAVEARHHRVSSRRSRSRRRCRPRRPASLSP